MTASAGRALATSFTAGEKIALAAFSTTPVFARLAGAMPAFQQLLADMSNEPTPAFAAKIEAMVPVAVDAFLTAEAATKKR